MTSRPLKDLIPTLILVVVALVVTIGAGWTVFPESTPSEDIARELETLRSRTVLGYTVVDREDRELAAYTYLGEKLPEKLSENEVVERRTETSWTRLEGYRNKGTPEEETILSTIIYPQQTFSQQPDGWYYLEHAVTSMEAMEEHEKENPIQAFFWKKVRAASISPFAAAGDGYVSSNAATWASAQSATTGTANDDTGANIFLQTIDTGKSSATINRGFLPFNTSSIPASATISAATLNIYVTSASITNFDNDGDDYVTVVQTSQGSISVLENADFDACGAVTNPTEGIDSGQRKDITSISNSAYLTFTLNATGRGWVKRSGESANCGGTTGYTCLGIREGHDTTNSSSGGNSVTFAASETSGTSQDPYLSVTYTTASASFWQFQDF